jgi:predicted SAM-dependent methyltransferase
MEKQTIRQIRLNVGCGMSPTNGFENFDNSFSLRISKYPILCALLYKLRVINSSQYNYIRYCACHKIKLADVVRHIPRPSGSVDLLYSSHMLEHLDRVEAARFLHEVLRVLKVGGVIRLVLPDLSKLIDGYNSNKDADVFIESLLVCVPNPRGIFQRIKFATIGNRHHLWMYDEQSLAKLLKNSGFADVRILKAGETTTDCGELNLFERAGESIYLEAVKR